MKKVRPFELLTVFRITLTDGFWTDFTKKKKKKKKSDSDIFPGYHIGA